MDPSMKQYDLVYDPESDEERYIFSNIDFEKLSPPFHIQREEPLQEEESDFSKKKSEIVEYEAEEYKALKDVEQYPLLVTDSDSRTYSGKLNNISIIGNEYFAFISMGSYIKVIPIAKWYGFVQKNQFYENNIEALENKLELSNEIEDSESRPDIDYEDNFDDDDENDKVIPIAKEKKLNSYGKKMKGLMENYEKEKRNKTLEKPKEDDIEIPSKHPAKDDMIQKKIKTSKELNKNILAKIFANNTISIKDLLKTVKQNYNLGEPEKKMIREFIYESCTFDVDSETGEKKFKLKK